MRPLFGVLAAQIILAGILLVLVWSGSLNFFGEFADDGETESAATTTQQTPAAATIDRFDEDRAWAWLKRQVALGPRPAGSKQSKKLAGQLKKALPNGR